MSPAKSRRLIAALALSSCVSAATLGAPAIADFAAQTDSIYPSISPDGNLVAFVTRAQGNRILMVVDLAKRERRALTGAIVLGDTGHRRIRCARHMRFTRSAREAAWRN